MGVHCSALIFFFNDTATTEIYTLALHDALPIYYGLIEKAKNIIVVKAKFDWSDLGSWNIIHDISPKNKDGNTIRGDALIIEGRNNFVQSNGQFIALLGLDNVVVITTDDATLVVAKDRVEEVKNVVKYLQDEKKGNLL